jgi:hypothetical protein
VAVHGQVAPEVVAGLAGDAASGPVPPGDPAPSAEADLLSPSSRLGGSSGQEPGLLLLCPLCPDRLVDEAAHPLPGLSVHLADSASRRVFYPSGRRSDSGESRRRWGVPWGVPSSIGIRPTS